MRFNQVLLAALFAASFSSAVSAQRTPRRTPAKTTPAQAKPAPAAQGGVNLTAADMALIVNGFGFPPDMIVRLASDAEERKRFAQDLRQMIATAEEAKSKGVGGSGATVATSSGTGQVS